MNIAGARVGDIVEIDPLDPWMAPKIGKVLIPLEPWEPPTTEDAAVSGQEAPGPPAEADPVLPLDPAAG